MWINDEQVNAILKGDDYKKVEAPQVGDVVVYSENGQVVHSVTVTSIDAESGEVTVEGLGGIETEVHKDPVTPGPNGAWKNADATYDYYRK